MSIVLIFNIFSFVRSDITKMEVHVDVYSDPIFIKREYHGDDSEFLRTMEGSDFRKHCRFCLTVPISTQIEKSLSIQDIECMYKSLTGTEVNMGNI